MIGIYDCFGYGTGYDVSFEERYKLIKRAGFDCVMLWWSDRFGRGGGYQKDVQFARDAGLTVENIHAPVHEQNFLSLDNLDGESVFQSYLQSVGNCSKNNIPTIVIHLPDDTYSLNNVGMERLKAIISEAENKEIQIAFENLSNINNLTLVLGSFFSFDGSIDWVEVMNNISLTGYKGATSLEPMNWDYEYLSIQQFLSLAYQKAKELNNIRAR